MYTMWRDTKPGGQVKTIRADYSGGLYIELTFGSEGYRPTEVINVWDYEKDEASCPFHNWENLSASMARAAIRAEIDNWVATNESEGWLDWYEGYLENARYAL